MLRTLDGYEWRRFNWKKDMLMRNSKKWWNMIVGDLTIVSGGRSSGRLGILGRRW